MNDRARWVGTFLLVLLLVYSRWPGVIVPVPSVSPIDAPGLHVLAVVETSALTPELASVLNSPAWQSLVPEGQWRVLDPDTDMSRDIAKWRDAMARPRASLPWVIVSNAPHGGYEGPLVPGELVALVTKWSKP